MWTLTHGFYHSLCSQLKAIGFVALTLGVVLIVYSFQLSERVTVNDQTAVQQATGATYFFALGAGMVAIGIASAICGSGLKHYASWAWYLFIGGLLPATLVASLGVIAFSIAQFHDVRDLVVICVAVGVSVSAGMLWRLLTKAESQAYFNTAQIAYREVVREASE